MISVAIHSRCLKWHVRLNHKKTKCMVVIRSWTYAPSYSDFTLGGTELEEAKSVRTLGITFDSKLTFETHLREVVSKAAGSLDVRKTGKLFDCQHVLKSCFNAYVLSNLEHCAPV